MGADEPTARELVRRHHLARSPSGAAALALAALRWLEGDLAGTAAWARVAVEREDRAHPGVWSTVRIQAALRLAIAAHHLGDEAATAEALTWARSAPFPKDRRGEGWSWTVDATACDLGAPASVALAERGLELLATGDAAPALVFHVATRVLNADPANHTLAERVVEVGTALPDPPLYVAEIVVAAVELLASRQLTTSAMVHRVVRLADRVGVPDLRARARIVLAAVEPERAVHHAREAVEVHPSPVTRRNLAIALVEVDPSEARRLALDLEREAVRDGRFGHAAEAAFTAAAAAAGPGGRPEDDLQRALLHDRRAERPTLLGASTRGSWRELLRRIGARDAPRARWLAGELLRRVPEDERADWAAALEG